MMKLGVRYRVTRASKHCEFQVGDHVWLVEDGAIMCPEARGWMKAENVPAATEGMEVEVDAEWLARKRAELEGLVGNTKGEQQ